MGPNPDCQHGGELRQNHGVRRRKSETANGPAALAGSWWSLAADSNRSAWRERGAWRGKKSINDQRALLINAANVTAKQNPQTNAGKKQRKEGRRVEGSAPRAVVTRLTDAVDAAGRSTSSGRPRANCEGSSHPACWHSRPAQHGGSSGMRTHLCWLRVAHFFKRQAIIHFRGSNTQGEERENKAAANHSPDIPCPSLSLLFFRGYCSASNHKKSNQNHSCDGNLSPI